MKRRFLQLTAKNSIKNKLIILSVIIIVIPMLSYFIMTNNDVSGYLKSQIVFSAQKAFDQTYSYLDYRILTLSNITSLVAGNDKIIEIVSRKGEYDIYDQFYDYNYIITYFNTFTDMGEEYKLKLYVPDNYIYSKESEYTSNFELLRGSRWFNRINNEGISILSTRASDFEPSDGSGGEYLSMGRIISSATDYKLPTGAIRVDFPEKITRDLLENSITVKNGLCYIVNSKDEIMSASNEAFVDNLKISAEEVDNIIRKNDWQTLDKDGELLLCNAREISNTDWTLVSVTSFQDIADNYRDFTRNMIIYLVIIIIATVIIVYFLSVSMTRKLTLLSQHMRKVTDGKLVAIPITDKAAFNNDEIDNLLVSYNYMVEQMQNLLLEKYKSGQEIRNAELKILQSQINPHFLYNIFDLVQWLARKNMTDKIISTVYAVSKFYKLSLYQGREMIPIRDELQHISLYVEIQNVRFKNQLELNIEASEEVKDFLITKTILQPIVENSILHGIQHKKIKSGKITVKAEVSGDAVIIKVIDDGVGITPQRLEEIKSGRLKSKNGSAFALKSIIKRINIAYGEGYYLNLESDTGGTTVTLKIPRIEDEEERNLLL